MARLRLEDFGASGTVARPSAVPDAALEDLRLQSYEQGFRAGWDDAVAAADSEAQTLRDTLAGNLADLSFTYAEAHRHVLIAIEPLLRDMVGKVLPAVARDAIAPMVLEQVMPVARELAGTPIDIVANRATGALLAPIVAAAPGIPLRIVEEPTLGDGQCHLRFADRERLIDLDAVIAAIGEAVADFFDRNDNERQHRHG